MKAKKFCVLYALLLSVSLLLLSGCSDGAGAKRLELAAVYDNAMLRNAVNEFNETSDIKINLVTYSFEELEKNAGSKNPPDMIWCTGEMFPPSKLTESFVNLTSFIEEDKKISEDGFITESFFGNSNNYRMLPVECSITTWYASEQINGTDRLSIEDIKQQSKYSKVFNAQMWDRETFLAWIEPFFVSSYIDLNSGKSDLKSSGLSDLLTEIKKSPLPSSENERGILSFVQIERGFDMPVRISYETDGKYLYYGIPNNGKYGSIIDVNGQIGMTSACKYKKIAWEFMRTLLSEENQKKVQHLPVVRQSFEALLSGPPAQHELSDEDKSKLYNLFDSVTECCWSDIGISEIINRNATKYFDDECTAEESVISMDYEINEYMKG